MAETLTDDDTTFNSTIQMPTSGETVGASDLRDKAVQRLSNRTAYLKSISDHYGRYTIATGTGGGLTEDFATGDFTLASNAVEVDRAGTYAVALTAALTSTSTSNPVVIELGISVATQGVYPTMATRFSATAADEVYVTGVTLVSITTASAEKISVALGASAGTPSVAAWTGGSTTNNNRLHIFRIA